MPLRSKARAAGGDRRIERRKYRALELFLVHGI